MTDSLEHRRRRALYRAQHRGTKEMDWLLGRYAEAALGEMDAPALTTFEELLQLPDTQLQSWILDPGQQVSDLHGLTPPAEARQFEPLIQTLRTFHGLDG